jgi:hypothetical protein
MVVNDDAANLKTRVVLRFFASKLAPTPCPRRIVIYSELARDYLKRHGESHYEH